MNNPTTKVRSALGTNESQSEYQKKNSAMPFLPCQISLGKACASMNHLTESNPLRFTDHLEKDALKIQRLLVQLAGPLRSGPQNSFWMGHMKAPDVYLWLPELLRQFGRDITDPFINACHSVWFAICCVGPDLTVSFCNGLL